MNRRDTRNITAVQDRETDPHKLELVARQGSLDAPLAYWAADDSSSSSSSS
jgi:hypothetical protein